MIQVVLEGWGIPYYSKLAQGSHRAEVTQALKSIVADEARHHGSGLLLFDEKQVSKAEALRMESHLAELLSMLRFGPFGVVSSLAQAHGGLDAREIKKFLDQTQFDEKMTADLALMKSLLGKAGASRLIVRMSERGLFDAPSSQECAILMAGALKKAA
jgi:hypothetical protein